MSKFTAAGGELLDDIVAKHYGAAAVSTALKEVLNANYLLSKFALNIPAGTIINLPDLPQSTTQVSLWD